MFRNQLKNLFRLILEPAKARNKKISGSTTGIQNGIKNDHTYAANSYSSTKRRKLDILNNTLEAEGLEEPVRDNSPNTSASYQNTLEDECLKKSERDVNHIYLKSILFACRVYTKNLESANTNKARFFRFFLKTD
ncbi:unnamed protein product [Gordionus sp. m RMFG-2023]